MQETLVFMTLRRNQNFSVYPCVSGPAPLYVDASAAESTNLESASPARAHIPSRTVAGKRA